MKKYLGLTLVGCSLLLTACGGDSASSGKPSYKVVTDNKQTDKGENTKVPECRVRDKKVTGASKRSCQFKNDSIKTDVIISCDNIGDKYLTLVGTIGTEKLAKGLYPSGITIGGYSLQCP